MNLTRRAFGLMAPALALAAAVVTGGGAAAQASTSSAAHVKPFAGVFNPIKNVGDNMRLQPVTPACELRGRPGALRLRQRHAGLAVRAGER